MKKGKNPVLSVHNTSKDYEIHGSNGARFLRQMMGRYSPVKPKVFPAVRNVSFDLYPGEAIAILGRNGAGKSTLLQLLSDLIRPTDGYIVRPDRIISLLELGSGFSPDFTGRENIRLNGAILGLDRASIDEKLPEIIDFADIGDYIDQPVRTYSSGMFLRLAFSIATTASPDLLMVDEVLAVGDIFFRQKCYERLNKMRERGTAIVLVTHSLSDASEFCDRGIVLSEGQVAYSGDAVGAVQYFIHHEQNARTGSRSELALNEVADNGAVELLEEAGTWLESPSAVDLSGSRQIGESKSVLLDKLLITTLEDKPLTMFQQGSWARIRVSFLFWQPATRVIAGIGLRNEKNILVHGKHGINVIDSASPARVSSGTRLEFTYELQLNLDLGQYTFDLGVAEVEEAAFRNRNMMTPAQIAAKITMLCSASGTGVISVVACDSGQYSSYSHVGIADLPNRFHVVATPADDARPRDASNA